MNFQQKRYQDISDHVEKDLILLSQCEDELRYEQDPSRKAQLRSKIEELKTQLATRESELADRKSSLDERLETTLRMFIAASYEGDQFAELDQAGETDPDKNTLLQRVFIDLEVKQRKGTQPRALQEINVAFQNDTSATPITDYVLVREGEKFSALDLLLREAWSRVVFIGGPGQGKSTLGQHVAQVHRANLLQKTCDHSPKTVRVPFRVVLKYYAQWLSTNSVSDDLETYLVQQIEKLSRRPISTEDIHEIFRLSPCVLILDGLDEVVSRELRGRMLARVREFVARMEQINANLMVIATSRPTGYDNQFDPSDYWHLELLPLSPEKVKEFATKWVQARKVREEEEIRILGTLEECQNDIGLKSLLVTPLQVTIILLIIKDGGRPPSQREALFDALWGTLFRREKSKDKGIIQSDESVLFGLHAYLGYVLHRRAAEQNVQSLLPEEDFRKNIRNYLRKDDRRSSDELINRRMEQLVSDARDRLVLLVEPETGLFGFDLRSIQEFFAGVYLTQTATETAKRFDRFKAIARPVHWRNVALFFAGRTSRNNSGEASNILELGCRPIDRSGVDRYLRRGAWLAVEVAADGAFGSNRDLQYSAVELGAEVLETGLVNDQLRALSNLFSRMSPDDRRDTLQPILEAQLRSLSAPRLSVALHLYGQFFGATDLFKDKIDLLLNVGHEEVTSAAIELAVRTKSDPSWLTKHLRDHWGLWKQRAPFWYAQHPAYFETLLCSLELTKDQITELIEIVWNIPWHFYSGHLRPEDVPHGFPELRSPIDHLVTMLRSVNERRYLRQPYFIETASVVAAEVNTDTFRMVERMRMLVDSTDSISDLSVMLIRSDLPPLLKGQLWKAYWRVTRPDRDNALAFLNDTWVIRQASPSKVHTYHWEDGSPWPLLKVAVKRQWQQGLEAGNSLLPYLEAERQIQVAEQVFTSLQNFMKQADAKRRERFVIAISFKLDLDTLLPELKALAAEIGISVSELVDAHDPAMLHTAQITISPEQFASVLELGKTILQSEQSIDQWFYPFETLTWPSDESSFNKALLFLKVATSVCSEHSDSAVMGECCLYTFLKLLAIDPGVEQLAPQVFTCLSYSSFIDYDDPIKRALSELPFERLVSLDKFLFVEDEKVSTGAAVFWKYIAYDWDEANDDDEEHPSLFGESGTLNFDKDSLLRLLFSRSGQRSAAGAYLFAFSDFPIEDSEMRDAIKKLVKWPTDAGTESNWAGFLTKAQVTDSNKYAWCDFLQEILDEPNKYGSMVLNSAAFKFQRLVGDESITITEAEERELGLP